MLCVCCATSLRSTDLNGTKRVQRNENRAEFILDQRVRGRTVIALSPVQFPAPPQRSHRVTPCLGDSPRRSCSLRAPIAGRLSSRSRASSGRGGGRVQARPNTPAIPNSVATTLCLHVAGALDCSRSTGPHSASDGRCKIGFGSDFAKAPHFEHCETARIPSRSLPLRRCARDRNAA